MTNYRYRPEIDGLRAISVIGVVLFHMGLGFPGGYVGVDVFFVISGFLITGIILKDMKRGTFSMLDFWVRRIRRIMPAVTVMVIACLLAGYWLLSPRDFTILGKSSIAQSVMAANVYFFGNTGYFAGSGDFKPLLHTWSLAVEEQFYVVFPIMLLVLWKWRKQSIVSGLLLVGFVSLALSCYGVTSFHQATFYLLPTRAWELLAGSVLAAWSGKKEQPKVLSEILSWAGMLMISGSMLFYSSGTLFPGWTAILPVGGAVMFIGANKHHLTSAGKLLALKPVVFIGLISYSLYLWHWPVIVFARNAIIDIHFFWQLALLLISILLGIASWRFVETPFRKKGVLDTRWPAFGFAAGCTILLLGLSVGIWHQNGLPMRFDPKVASYIKDTDYIGEGYESDGTSHIWLGADTLNASSLKLTQADFAIWGDSHGRVVAETISRVAKEKGIQGVCFLKSATPPVVGVYSEHLSMEDREHRLKRNEDIFNALIKARVKHVILVAHWSGSFIESRAVDENREGLHDTRTSAEIMSQRIGDMAKKFRENGITLWFVREVPNIENDRVAAEFYSSKRFSNINKVSDILGCTLSKKEYEQQQRGIDQVMSRWTDQELKQVKLAPYFFQGGSDLKAYGEYAYYRDSHHLSFSGARHWMTPVFEDVFRQIIVANNNEESVKLNTDKR